MLVAPAGPVSRERVRTALRHCRQLGLEPLLGPSAQARNGYLAGPDEQRTADLQAAFDDNDIAAVWAIRGGYGTMRLLRSLDFSAMARRPKPVIGFSDNTALHLALARAGVVSFHGPHAGFVDFPDWTRDCFRKVLFVAEPPGRLPIAPDEGPAATLRAGCAEGALTGGNLSLLAALCGTPWAPETRDSIVLIEDVSEPVYRIDRMLAQLTLSGAMDGVRGVVFGHFTRVTPLRDQRPLGVVLKEWVDDLGVPAVAGMPFGHIGHNWTLPLGVRARLDADAGTLDIIESAVTQ